MLIPGENALVFVPHGYGFAVLVGRVAAEYPHGWVIDPCREVLDTRNGDCWVQLANGTDKKLRQDCQYGPPMKAGFRAPLGCCSLAWQGDLPGEG